MQNATPQRKCFVPIASIIGGISIILLTFTYLLFESKSYSNDRIRLPYSNYFISVVEFAPDLGVECTLLAGNIAVQKFTINNVGADIRVTNIIGDSFTITGTHGSVLFHQVSYIPVLYEIRHHVYKPLTNSIFCFDFNSVAWSWYGGPSQAHQSFPIGKSVIFEYDYVPKYYRHMSIADRYWLNSVGSFMYVSNGAHVALYQNLENEDTLCLNITQDNMKLSIGLADDAKEAHRLAMRSLLMNNMWIPKLKTTYQTIWSTGARFGAEINETALLNFAEEIERYGVGLGQISINDYWEECYGTLTFNRKKFPNIGNVTNQLKSKGFRLAVSIHPFVNKECKEIYLAGMRQRYFIGSLNAEDPSTTWWHSGINKAVHIDFTQSEAAQWFNERMDNLQLRENIHNFHFYGGEIDLMPQVTSPLESMTFAYLNYIEQYGDMSSIGIGFYNQKTLNHLRMPKLESTWSWNNGLPNLITKVLHMSMLGYDFVIPDVVGGSAIPNKKPDKELFIRWMQAAIFMPFIQFSYAPWDYDEETMNIGKDLMLLRRKVWSDVQPILSLDITPVIAPIWWLDPKDQYALKINDEFLVHGWLLAAPVLKQGKTNRSIYLPYGTWTDGNTNAIIAGPKLLENYPAPLDKIPHFILS